MSSPHLESTILPVFVYPSRDILHAYMCTCIYLYPTFEKLTWKPTIQTVDFKYTLLFILIKYITTYKLVSFFLIAA